MGKSDGDAIIDPGTESDIDPGTESDIDPGTESDIDPDASIETTSVADSEEAARNAEAEAESARALANSARDAETVAASETIAATVADTVATNESEKLRLEILTWQSETSRHLSLMAETQATLLALTATNSQAVLRLTEIMEMVGAAKLTPLPTPQIPLAQPENAADPETPHPANPDIKSGPTSDEPKEKPIPQSQQPQPVRQKERRWM